MMFRLFHGDIGGLFVAIFVIFVLVRLSARASGYSRRSFRQHRRNLRGGMFGPGFWGGNFGPRNNFFNPYDPNNVNNPGANGAPPTNGYNQYPNGNPDPNAGNNFYAPPGSYYQPNTPPPAVRSTGRSQPRMPTTSTSTAQPSATHTVRGWEMPDNQAVLKEAYVWVRNIAGWSYAGKLIVDGTLRKDEVKRYAQGKFGAADNDLISIEAASYDDAKRVFEGYHLY